MTVGAYFSGLFKGILSLLTGMKVTLIELFTPKITQQYPENRSTLVISDRFRGELVMPHDNNNEHACTACGICQMSCPNGTIKVVSDMVEQEDGKKKRVLNTYNYDLGTCTFCNLCVISCPTNAIEFSNNFENAVYTRGKLQQKLNAEGSKLRDKKATPKPAAPKPAAAAATEAKAEVAKEAPKAEKAPEVKVEPKKEAEKPEEKKDDNKE